MHHIIIITLLFQAFGSQLIAELTLSEFLADNKRGITDEDNDYSDWIEITNTTNTNVNLEGWHLTDNRSDLTKWTFPPIEIAANNQLIVFASGKDRIAINSELHTNFLLDSDGEFLALTKPDGISIAKSFNYPRQKEDTSYGNSTKVFDSAVISTSSSAKWLIPNDSVQGWQETNFDDSSWDPAKLGIGYDISSDYDPFFETDVLGQMRSLQTSIYIRVPFQIESPESVSDIKLKMNYDDGFIAWINGKQIASSNAPLVPEWNARATSSHRDSEAVQKLTAARLAADIANVPLIILARTDANAAKLITNDHDDNDKPFLTGERSPEGFYYVKAGIDQAISRGLAYAPYSDLIWCETATPNLEEAKKFADAIHKKFPGKLLAYNCSPSFNWKKHLSDEEIASFQQEISKMGYKFQFITLAGFHTQNIAIFELAEKYKKEGMSAYSRIQEQEFAREKDGYTSVKHQREVGTSYFDAVSNTISSGKSSTTAMDGSTESEQF